MSGGGRPVRRDERGTARPRRAGHAFAAMRARIGVGKRRDADVGGDGGDGGGDGDEADGQETAHGDHAMEAPLSVKA